MKSLRGWARERDEAQRGQTSEFQFGDACACHRNADDQALPAQCQPVIALARAHSLQSRQRTTETVSIGPNHATVGAEHPVDHGWIAGPRVENHRAWHAASGEAQD
jgi:hypothetical protein